MSRDYLLNPSSIDRVVDCDLLVAGSGVAGMVAALKASRFCKVAVVTKSFLREGATRYAQGGVAIAVGPADSPELHLKDTLVAGAGLCEPETVKILVNDGPDCYRELLSLGAEFDSRNGAVSLRREGGHSLARVVHHGDATGSEIERTLSRAIRNNPNIELYEHSFLVDLVTGGTRCTGVLAWTDGGPLLVRSKATLLATGGAGQLYGATTNPIISTGDGIAAAARAGARLGDLEFMQFHPTALHVEDNPRFLISEALRGEGAQLLDASGSRFMVDRHPLAELAPRDIVVRAMAETMQSSGADFLYLDLRHLDQTYIAAEFPTIYQKLVDEGFRPGTDLIPISFAAHYFIGGVVTDVWGRTSLEGLYASGEVACTGIHGANRLASNSLLEGLVFSRRIVTDLEHYLGRASKSEAGSSSAADSPDFRPSAPTEPLPADARFAQVSLLKDSLAQIMRDGAGVFRSRVRLEDVLSKLPAIEDEARALLAPGKDPVPPWEVINMTTLAGGVARACIAREESRGAHLREEFPEQNPEWARRHTVFESGSQRQVSHLADGIRWKD